MRLDFQTTQQKEAQKHLNKKKKRSRKESLESQMRLTGSKSFQSMNRHRHPQQTCMMEQEPVNNTSLLQDIEQSKHISSTPVRYRSMKDAIDKSEVQNTHKINLDIMD